VDDDFYRWREEEQVKREAGRDILVHMDARRQADQARTERLVETLTRGIDAEQDDDPDDEDLKEAA